MADEVNIQRAEAAKKCFGFNKKLNTVFVTSDCTCFPQKNDAVQHAKKLDNKTIDQFDRDEKNS